MATNRKIYLDVLRILACFFVIYNHTPGYLAYYEMSSICCSFLSMFLTMVTRINVPLFFMISGTLLLGKDVNYKELLSKRLLRILGALVCASVVSYLISGRNNIASLSLRDFFYRFLYANIENAYWYLYAYLGFLLMLPFLRSAARHITKSEFVLLIVVHFIFETFFPLINYILGQFGLMGLSISGYVGIPFATSKAFFYPLIGYYIDRVINVEKIEARKIMLAPLVVIICIFIASCFTYHQGVNSGYTQDFVQTFDYIVAMCVFILIKYLFVKKDYLNKNERLIKIIQTIGMLTFGIYLMDPVFNGFYGKLCAVLPPLNPVLLSIAWCIFSMTVCGMVTYILKKIPFVKALL